MSEALKSFGGEKKKKIGIRDITKALGKAKKSIPRHSTNDELNEEFGFSTTQPTSPLPSSRSNTENLQQSEYIPPPFPWWSNGQLNAPDFKKPPFGEFIGFPQKQSNDCREVI